MQAILGRFIRRTNTSTPSTTVNASRKEVIQCEDSDDDGSEDETQQGSAEEAKDCSYIIQFPL